MNIATHSEQFNNLVTPALKTTSRIVADSFGKLHKDVLKSVRNLECSNDFSERNFAPTSYVDVQGKEHTEYAMTRDGFTFLAMGFTGKDSAHWKEKYIDAFNAMEAQLKQAPVLDLNDPTQLRGLLGSYAERTEIAEAKVFALEPKAVALDRLDTAAGCLTPRPASKVLGVGERVLIKWLEVNSWSFRQNGKGPLQAYSDKIKVGYLDHKLHSYEDNNTGETKTSIQMLITAKGLARLADLIPIGGAS